MREPEFEELLIDDSERRKCGRLIEFENCASRPLRVHSVQDSIDRAACPFIRALHGGEVRIRLDVIGGQEQVLDTGDGGGPGGPGANGVNEEGLLILCDQKVEQIQHDKICKGGCSSICLYRFQLFHQFLTGG